MQMLQRIRRDERRLEDHAGVEHPPYCRIRSSRLRDDSGRLDDDDILQSRVTHHRFVNYTLTPSNYNCIQMRHVGGDLRKKIVSLRPGEYWIARPRVAHQLHSASGNWNSSRCLDHAVHLHVLRRL